ncbi:MAG: porphobilinogen synthase [Omnitrophica bacterium]|nr:porphobilinogen synthase [Candidatus Omnitrophota bacterium]
MPLVKLGRLRGKSRVRNWVSETRLGPEHIIMPYFVREGRNVNEPIPSMPGLSRLSVENLLPDIRKARGIKSVLLFGIPKAKDESGTTAYKKNGVIQKAIKAVKAEFGDLIVITDVCLCAYTTHGHCGIVKKNTGDAVDTDATLKTLTKIAVSHAEAGADFVAPSAMMDGEVKAIREALDKKGFKNTGILAYSAKYASAFYGPFRDVAGSMPRFGDRKAYQMDYRNSNEAMREIAQDIEEGADIVMVKPALSSLDIIYRAKQKFDVPLCAYNVSGEYSMIKNLANGDKTREKNLILEVLTSIKRSGADFIVTYFGKEVLKWL